MARMTHAEMENFANAADRFAADAADVPKASAEAVADALRLANGDIGLDNGSQLLRAIAAHLVADETEAPDLTVAEIHYLARCVDLGRSDPQASALLPPTGRDDLLRKLGGRRT